MKYFVDYFDGLSLIYSFQIIIFEKLKERCIQSAEKQFN